MEAIRSKLGGNAASPEERAKHQQQLVLPNIGSILISTVMVVIGAQYYDERYCRNEAPLFLLIGGGISLGMTGLKLLAWLTPCEFDDKVADFLSPIANLANFCVLIWGSVVVFGAYATWQYEEESLKTFCNYTPFMFAFVLLILEWVLLPIIITLEIICICGLTCCGLCCAAFTYSSPNPNPPPNTV